MSRDGYGAAAIARVRTNVGRALTKQIADEFFGIANGLKHDRFGWLTPVKVKASEPVTA